MPQPEDINWLDKVLFVSPDWDGSKGDDVWLSDIPRRGRVLLSGTDTELNMEMLKRILEDEDG